MKRYILTVRLPTRNGAPTQQIIADHAAPTIDALTDVLNSNDFICVRQLHRVHGSGFEFAGEIILNTTDCIGKVREFQDRPFQDD